MKRIYLALLGLLLSLTLAITPTFPLWSQTPSPLPSSPPTAIGETSTYQSVACAILTAAPAGSDQSASQSPFPSEAVEGKDYECGYLTVPELHSQPNGKTIQVGIAILKSTRPNPAEPFMMFQGGPGGSSIDIFPEIMLDATLSGNMRSERDLIVFEKRGNRYSQPYLACPEYQEDNINLDQSALSKTLEGLKACRNRLSQAGVNLAAFNSVESAHDVAALAKALNYKQVNLYGVSYGTELAQDVLRLHPDLVRSVILDGVVPSEPSLDSQYAVILDRLITQVDAACAQDADCHALYPDVKGTFAATYERLNQTPGSVRLFTAQGVEQQPVTGLNLAQTIFEMSYMSGAPFVIPALIDQASENNFTIIANSRYMSQSGGIATGTYYSVKCSEDAAYAKMLDTNGVAPYAQEWGSLLFNFMKKACQVWNVPQLDPSVRAAVVSDTPALILNGNFDPITPPPFGAKVAQGFKNKTDVVFPDRGHGAIGSPCTAKIMSAFVSNPNQPPDTSCASEGKIEFITEKNTLIAPGTVWLTRSLLELDLAPLMHRVLLLVILILFPLVWLGFWLVARLRRQGRPTSVPWGAKFSPWLGVLLALLSAAWIGLQLLGLETTLVLNTPNFFLGFYRLSVGLERSFAWIYIVPILIALVAMGMAGFAVLSWKHHYWGKARRIYYSFTAGVAIAYTLFLAAAGQLTVFL